MIYAGSKALACFALLGTAWFVFAGGLKADANDWWQFRGPIGGEPINASNWPDNWSESENIAWSTEIPGQGWSSPIVIGERAYVTSAVSEEIGRPAGFGAGVAAMSTYRKERGPQQPINFQVTCLNMNDGSVEWNKTVSDLRPPAFFHPSNTFATESPTTDGEFLYVTFQAVGVVACLDLEGEVIWSREFGVFETGNDFGTGSSLAYHDGKLFVQNDNEEDSFLVCLDTETGEDLWRIEHESTTCWSTPLVWHNSAGVHLVVCGSNDVVCLEPESGEEVWSLTGMGGSFSSSPAADQDVVIFGNSGPGRRGPLVAVSADAQGDLSVSEETDGIAWVMRGAGPGMASPVVMDGLAYVIGQGIITCHDAKTGREVYKQRLPSSSSVAASPVMDKERLVILNERGTAYVLRAGREFQISEENEIPGLYWSSPAATQDALLLRSSDRVYCIRGE